MTKFGNNTFAYGADGIRYQKNNITYTLDENKILQETDGVKTLSYYYGVNGVIGFRYEKDNVQTDYFYRKNLFGDVVAIYDAHGSLVAQYEYDAWGKVTVTNYNFEAYAVHENVGDLNPIRYRSYYYDIETDLYYLESRYYDPETGRFISADSLEYLGDGEELNNYNLFAYCENNPVMYSDPTGHLAILGTLFISTLIGSAFGFGLEIAKQVYNGGDFNFDFETWDWSEIVYKAVLGAATGFAYGAGGVAGGIIKGSISTIGALTEVQSVGALLGTAAAINFTVGTGVSIARNSQDKGTVDILKASSAGIGQAGKGVFSFFAGGMYSASGIWNIGKKAHNSLYSIVARSAGRSLISFIPNMIFSMFE